MPFLYSGATNHITSKMTNLDLFNEYDGEDTVTTGNGQGLSITHSGHSFLHANSHSFCDIPIFDYA